MLRIFLLIFFSVTVFAGPRDLIPGRSLKGPAEVHDKFTGWNLIVPDGWAVAIFDHSIFSNLDRKYGIRFSKAGAKVDVTLSNAKARSFPPLKNCNAKTNSFECSGQAGHMKINVKGRFASENLKREGQKICDGLKFWTEENEAFDLLFWRIKLPLPRAVKTVGLVTETNPTNEQQIVFNTGANEKSCIIFVIATPLKPESNPQLDAFDTWERKKNTFIKEYDGERVLVSVNQIQSADPDCNVSHNAYLKRVAAWAE